MRNCLVIDLDRCTGCDSCVVACKFENGFDLGERVNRVEVVGPAGTFPNIEQYWLPMQCQQCENAPCIEVCPTGASYRDDEFGLVLVDAETCIGCQLCMSACPFDARTYNETLGVVEKCTGCIQRLREGEEPACVHNCCAGGRFFGDLDDPDSDAAKAVAAAGEENCHRLADNDGADARTVYILSSKTAAWNDRG
jgi:Fe-S-cluster-containing dehydrogenase component